MDLIFNELSLTDRPDSEYQAKQLLENLAKTCSVFKIAGFKKLRIESDFWNQLYFNDTDLNSFLSRINRTKQNFLRSFIRPPYIAADFTSEVDKEYAANDYYFNDTKVTGLAYAYLINTIAISLYSTDTWENTEIEIIERKDTTENNVTVKHACKSEHYNTHREWIEGNQPVVLIKTTRLPENKQIKLRDDHGKDVLQDFAKKIVNCEYVVSVNNSLPFSPHKRNFIKKVYPNGQIEIGLTNTDQGYGIIIQTTGRTQRETDKIAKIIEKKYN